VTTTHRSRATLAAAVLAVAVGASVIFPATSAAQQDPSEEREQVRERQAQVGVELDALEAQSDDVTAAIADLEENVGNQEAELAEAQRASDAADQDVVDAEQAVADAEERIVELDAATDEVVAQAFMAGPSAGALDALTAETLSDAAVTQALLDLQADSDADLLDQLDAAHEDLAIEEQNKVDAAAAAAEAEQGASDALDDLNSALAEQQEFAAEVEDAIDQRLIEADNLRNTDAELSREIEEQQRELARRLEAARQAAEASQGTPPPPPSGGGGAASIQPAGDLSTVSCPSGGSITVASSLAGNLSRFLSLAGQQGVPICGSGYRDPQRQIELRAAHCGPSDYAIYQMPSGQCSPPTARPGRSQHEIGLAIDFTCNGGGSIVRGGSCWNFLSAHANDHGLYNLPSEIWHWSTTGR
jgi:peptidoglycan hydrolase CwlO-like protein